ncbi:hypothetical protein MVEN_01958000 [Mycena venus]|uniref:F-box domain-containing protein n=1 Tax=Mycena venus TaxID=2733690 RepID=A0A8H6XHD1_9AGAR|nr:hypothetical protein MVEN_01958000 [Mycena venus]
MAVLSWDGGKMAVDGHHSVDVSIASWPFSVLPSSLSIVPQRWSGIEFRDFQRFSQYRVHSQVIGPEGIGTLSERIPRLARVFFVSRCSPTFMPAGRIACAQALAQTAHFSALLDPSPHHRKLGRLLSDSHGHGVLQCDLRVPNDFEAPCRPPSQTHCPRGIMRLFPSRLSARAASSQQRVANTLPAELVVEIASHLTWAIDVLNFSLTSSHLRTILLPEMYKSVFLFAGSWTKAFELFARRPELCVHVRTLRIDLFYEALRPERWQEEVDIDHIAALIENASKHLSNLHTFDWSGRRLPPDHLFLTLRKTCPKLKNLHLCASFIRFDPASELFKFDDLAGFSLWVDYEDKVDADPPPFQEIPVQLGDMLLERCPNLDSLCIRLRSMPNMWVQEVDRLVSGVWPKLEFCHFDIEIIESEPISLWPPISTLRRFLSAHASSLTDLGFTAYAILPTTVFARELPLCFDPDAPLASQLDCFEGLLQHVSELPNPEALKTLILGTVISETNLGPMLPVLRGLTSLKELTLEFSDIDASTVIRDIVSVCPNLVSLYTKFYKTTFNLKQLIEVSSQLKHLPKLRSLYLDKVHSAADSTLLKAALILLGDSPLLEEICIVNFMAKRWYQRGHYLIVTDAKGRRVISARETGLDTDYPKGRLVGRVYPRGKYNRTFRYSLGRDVFGSISRRFKRIRR